MPVRLPVTDPTRLGKYEIQRVLGKGAMGIVYQAVDPHIERVVALKTLRKDVLDSELAEQFMGRFRNEAKAAGRLHHPNIVGIYEYGEDERVAYIAMEYVEGTGLREFLNRGARFELGQVVAIMAQLLQALEFAHGRGVVHRDIKPSNLILTADGTLKVADFGIARIDTSGLTMTGLVIGTPSYMAPEQCQGKVADHRCDLFSAGVVMYELVTGRKPFAGSMDAVAYQICHQAAVPPSQAGATVPHEIDALLDTALAKDPDQRFQNARAFHTALRAAAGEAVPPAGNSDGTLLDLAAVPLGPAPAATWDQTVLSTVERELALIVGPMARYMVRSAAPKAHDVDELYALLASHIDDPVRRERFVAHPAVGASAGPHGTGGAAVGARTAGSQAGATGTARPATAATRAAPPRPLEPAFIAHATARLAVYLGPIAKVLARRAAEQCPHAEEFARRLAEHVGTQDRAEFLRTLRYDDG
jgi:serine/threonine-protein kinase